VHSSVLTEEMQRRLSENYRRLHLVSTPPSLCLFYFSFFPVSFLFFVQKHTSLISLCIDVVAKHRDHYPDSFFLPDSPATPHSSPIVSSLASSSSSSPDSSSFSSWIFLPIPSELSAKILHSRHFYGVPTKNIELDSYVLRDAESSKRKENDLLGNSFTL
jgi:hypothetical protein